MKLLAIFLVAISLNYGQGQEEIGIIKPPYLQPCEMECQKKGGECSWKSPGKGYKNTGFCRSGKWGTGTNCYCGYCWVNNQLPCNGQKECKGLNLQPGYCSPTPIKGLVASGYCKYIIGGPKPCTCWVKPCDGQIKCLGLKGEGGLCSQTQIPGYVASGQCLSMAGTKGCTCWVKEVSEPCNGQKECKGLQGEPGFCSQTPIAGSIKSGKCPPGDGKSCDCWVKQVAQDCEQKECSGQEGQRGKCSATMPGSGMVVSGACESSGVKKCPCWVLEDQRPCGDEIYCEGENGLQGKCFKERPTKGSWMRSGRCERSGCTCYVPCKGSGCKMEIA